MIIEQIVARVFVSQASGLEVEAQRFDALAFSQTVSELRRSMIRTVACLPDPSFDIRDDASVHEENWSAGQIVSHNTDRLLWVVSQILPLVSSMHLEIPGSLVQFARQEPTPLTRAESLAALEQANEVVTTLFASLSDDDRLLVTSNTRFGEMSWKGWLLLLVFHDHDHAGQLSCGRHWRD